MRATKDHLYVLIPVAFVAMLAIIVVVMAMEIRDLRYGIEVAAGDVVLSQDRARELEAQVEDRDRVIASHEAEIDELLELLERQQREIERLEVVADLLSPPVDATTPVEPEPTPTVERNTSTAPTGEGCDPAMTNCWLDGEWLCGEHAAAGPCTPQAQCPGFEHECWLHCRAPLNPVSDCYAFDPDDLSENP